MVGRRSLDGLDAPLTSLQLLRPSWPASLHGGKPQVALPRRLAERMAGRLTTTVVGSGFTVRPGANGTPHAGCRGTCEPARSHVRGVAEVSKEWKEITDD